MTLTIIKKPAEIVVNAKREILKAKTRRGVESAWIRAIDRLYATDLEADQIDGYLNNLRPFYERYWVAKFWNHGNRRTRNRGGL